MFVYMDLKVCVGIGSATLTMFEVRWYSRVRHFNAGLSTLFSSEHSEVDKGESGSMTFSRAVGRDV